MAKITIWRLLSIALLCTLTISSLQVNADTPTETECRPHIEKALNTLKADNKEPDSAEVVVEVDDSKEADVADVDSDDDDSDEAKNDLNTDDDSKEESTNENETDVGDNSTETEDDSKEDDTDSKQDDDKDSKEDDNDDADADSKESDNDEKDSSKADDDDQDSKENDDSKDQTDSGEQGDDKNDSKDDDDDDDKSNEADDKDSKEQATSKEGSVEQDDDGDSGEAAASKEKSATDDVDSGETTSNEEIATSENAEEDSGETASNEVIDTTSDNAEDSEETVSNEADSTIDDNAEGSEETPSNEENVESDTTEDSGETGSNEEIATSDNAEDSNEQKDDDDDDDSKENGSKDDDKDSKEGDSKNADDSKEDDNDSKQDDDKDSKEGDSDDDDDGSKEEAKEPSAIKKRSASESHEITAKSYPVDDLLLESEIPENLRDRSHVDEILHLNEDSDAENEAMQKVADKTLNDLKKIYENAIKPLETLYKYRDLSNRHFGDPEIFSKPLVLLMGPWSGGKSSIINYLTDNEHNENSLKTGAEPSLPYFNILMHGENVEVLDGTQLSADWTFSGLQKFGQGLTDRLRGLKLPSKLLEKVNIVEIPGILEVRKHVSRIFPFNDACQWFIDRADIIFLVYDPSKLDVGPETEAILDQLKGREYQTRIVLNKADQVHPEELLRVQSALIWNISPLMSSQQPPVMYTVSLWSHPFEENSPVRLLQAQEKALLQDLDQAIEHRIENKIASARRFAVRVRNHAKMVDCYLTTYYNHKTLFGNKKKISGEIVEHPQNYHIYEGLSTLTNISRYDLPDPEVYRDFFKLNPLYEFKKLSETCTYFRGCPINKLDVAIAYDLPELVNRYKRAVSQALNTLELSNASNDSTPTTQKR